MKSIWNNKITDGILVIAAVLAIIEFFVERLPKVHWLNFLSIKLIEINILRIILIFIVVIIFHKFIPIRYKSHKNKQRAENFRNNWNEFKEILIDYKKSGEPSLQERYSCLRDDLERDFGYFRPTILSIESLAHRTKHLDGVLIYFELCFSVRDISRWSEKIQRGIPEELDCFDYLLNALVGHYENK